MDRVVKGRPAKWKMAMPAVKRVAQPHNTRMSAAETDNLNVDPCSAHIGKDIDCAFISEAAPGFSSGSK